MNTMVFLPILTAMPTTAPAMPCDDPIFAIIERHKALSATYDALVSDDRVGDNSPNFRDIDARSEQAGGALIRHANKMFSTSPTTVQGIAALMRYVQSLEDWQMPTRPAGEQEICGEGEECHWFRVLCSTVARAAEIAIVAPSIVDAAGDVTPQRAADAELIALGNRFDGVVTAYYSAHRRWQVDDEIEASSDLWGQLSDLSKKIYALPATSIGGLRAKALAAFWEVCPLTRNDTEYHFGDDYAFQQLFLGVAGACGLTGMINATGYDLPDISVEEDEEESEDA